MSDREAFIRHIAEHPHADLPRLVFADWLDERDDPLGLFIRTQIELDPIREQIELSRTRELLALEEELLRDHEETWLAPLWDFRQQWDSTARPFFRRGFPHAVCLLADELHEDGEQWIKLFPTIRELAVCGLGDSGDRVGNHALMRQIDVFELVELPTADDFAPLIHSDHFGRVPLVRFWNAGFGSCPLFHITPPDWRPGGTVEYVQLLGGLATGPNAGAYDREADECAAEFNAVWGEGVVRVVRPFQRKFAFHQDDDSFPAGRLPNGNRGIVFLGGHEPDVAVAEFDETGYVRTTHHPKPVFQYWDGFLKWMREDLRLRPESIRVPEFCTDRDQGVRLWRLGDLPRLEGNQFDELETWEWLHNRRHYIFGKGGHWADYRGFVTAS